MATVTADDTVAPAAATRSITPRRGLPSGRAVVGALLVTVAAVGTFAVASSGDGSPDTSYVVVAQPIEAGSPVVLGAVELAPLELTAAVAANALTSIGGVDGATAVRDLHPGELLSATDLVAAPDVAGSPVGAIHELAFPVPRERLPARTVSGDRVTVLATLRAGNEARTVVAIEDALVLAWRTDGDGIGSSSTGVLTLAVETADGALELAHLAQEGDLTVVRTTRATSDVYPPSYTAAVSPAVAGEAEG